MTLFALFVKLIILSRVHPKLGSIVRLSYMVFFEAAYFTLFFYSTIVFFAIGYWVLGNQAGGHPTSTDDGNDYERLSIFMD